MSASPMARQAVGTQAIPIKRVLLNDPSEMPSHYSETPGGTMFSTTPGGTKIIYEKNFLLNLRNSPISKTPPTFGLPDNIVKGSSNSNPKKPSHNNNHYPRKNNLPPRKRNDSYNAKRNSSQDDDHQFELDL